MAVVLVVAGLLFLWLATQVGWFGLSAESVAALPKARLAVALVVLLVLWLWKRRAKWH